MNDPKNAQFKISHLYAKIYEHLDEITEVREFDTEDMDVLIITSGSTTRAAREAVKEARAAGMKVGVLQLISVWPFPDAEVKALAERAGKVIVPEMNLGQMILEVKRVLDSTIPVFGFNKTNGLGITPAEILGRIKEVY